MLKYLPLLLLAPAPAWAQADPAAPATDARGDDVVVTANRAGDATPPRDLPASVTLLDAAALDQRQTRVVSDVLRDVPGLAVSRAGGVGALTQVRVRGAESNHVLVLVDGIEASDPYQGEFDFGSLIADDSARIEVLRGQQSSLYGSDAIGGVIHYITATGRDAPGIRLRAEGGTLGTVTGSARAGGVAGALDYAATATLYRTDGTPNARDGTRDLGSTSIGATAKATWRPSDAFALTAVARYSRVKAEFNDTDFDPTSPTFGFIVDTPGNDFRVEGLYGIVRADLSLADGRWTNALVAQIADTSRRNYSSAGLSFGNDGRRYKGSFETAYRLTTGAAEHRLTGAVDVEREEFRTVSPSPFAFTGERHIDNVGLVAAYDLSVGEALAAGVSVRRDLNTRFADATTWRAQGGYRFDFGTRLRGAYGTGVKNPGYFELYGFQDGRYIGNPGLRPEKSKGWEAGVDQAIGTRASVGATYFRSHLDGEIFTDFPPPAFVASPANRTTRSRQRGVEVFANAEPIPLLRLDLAYTYTKARENGVREVRRPAHVGSVNATVFSADKRFSTTLTARYNGRQDDDAFIDPSFVPVRVSLQEYVLVNLAARYAISDGLELFGRVENLTDEKYEELFSYRAAGRGAYAGVRARF